MLQTYGAGDNIVGWLASSPSTESDGEDDLMRKDPKGDAGEEAFSIYKHK